jgi:hypothetical protein
MERVPSVSGTASLLDILDRVLDKGLVIAGDVRVSLANHPHSAADLFGRQGGANRFELVEVRS